MNIRPRVVISRCLGIDACRYNGQQLNGDLMTRLAPHVEWVDVCPEVEIGLGVPRPPVRLLRDGELKLYQPEHARDLTAQMQAYCTALFDRLGVVDGFLLKSASPSCGLKGVKVYDGSGMPTHERTAGMFGRAVLERYAGHAMEDEARLGNSHLRHHFFTRIFLSAEVRAAMSSGRIADLIRFHSRHKLLLMGYSPSGLQRMGVLLGSNAGESAPLAEEYRSALADVLHQPPSPRRIVNVVQHAFGYVSRELSARERQHFLDTLEAYRTGLGSLDALLALLQSWAIGFGSEYLEQQSLFEPYPRELRHAPLERRPAAMGR